MTDIKITQGDWVIKGYAGQHDEAGAIIKSGDKTICSTGHVTNKNWDEYYANANLISLSPKLLERVESCMGFLAMINSDSARNEYDKCKELLEALK